MCAAAPAIEPYPQMFMVLQGLHEPALLVVIQCMLRLLKLLDLRSSQVKGIQELFCEPLKCASKHLHVEAVRLYWLVHQMKASFQISCCCSDVQTTVGPSQIIGQS